MPASRQRTNLSVLSSTTSSGSMQPRVSKTTTSCTEGSTMANAATAMRPAPKPNETATASAVMSTRPVIR